MPVTVVNMIPNSLSNESVRDSEPNISASFLDPDRIAASAFTPDPAGSANAPIYISTDGGNTWTLNVVLPAGGSKTNDTTLRFVGGSNVLYAGILRFDNLAMNILRAGDFTAPSLMTVLVTKPNDDQPYVEGGTVLGGAGVGSDRVYVGENDFGAASGATIDFSLDAATAPAPANFVTTTSIETRATSGQDGPAIRPAVHPDGTVYGLFMGWRSATTMDIVVVRDDNWASSANPFTALIDADGSAGKRVVTAVSRCTLGDLLGTQRVGGQCAIAVDPRDSSTVYVAWADGTLGSNQTIHVRRSTDRGVTWSADLVSIATATNPGLAVNRQGAVGFLYQQLHNPGPGNRWQTHFQYSTDAFATVTDIVLADLPDSKGSYTGSNTIGDYAGLISVGKNFYGVFCGFNTPDNANFQQGVTYQRNADFTTHTLTDLGGNPVADSIDPFFFRYDTVSASDDFYVRDWTDNPTSGDNGVEPSTHAVFYQTCDVWNRRGTLPGSFPNDQPDNEDAGNGSGNVGDNWAFARIRRNTPSASGSQDVTAHFLVSKFGTGSNYVDSTSGDPDITFLGADPVVTFAATDLGPFVTDAYQWHLSAVASTHLCLAVEITASNDPYSPPSLAGNTPGWPTTDLRIINDNNKAQRNMGLSTTPARGVGMSDCYYAIAHNAAPFARDMELRYEVPRDALHAMRASVIQVVGGERFPVGEAGTVHLKNMRPGENRWIGLHFPAAHGDAGHTYTINFFELSGGIVVNGFAMGARLGSLEAVIREKLHEIRSVFGRIAAGWYVNTAREIAERCHRHIEEERYDIRDFLIFLREHIHGIESALAELLREHASGSAFGIRIALAGLVRAIEEGDVAPAAVAASCLLNSTDSWLTMLQLEQGDVADILQTVRWQRRLFTVDRRLKELGRRAEVVVRSERFIRDYEFRNLSNSDYPPFLADLRDGFEEVAHSAPELALTSVARQLYQGGDDLRALQRSHAQLLGRLQQSHVAG